MEQLRSPPRMSLSRTRVPHFSSLLREVWIFADLQLLFNSVQIQPANVRTRKGYAKKGRGREVGNTCSPQNILDAVIAKRIEPMMPARRTPMANCLGIHVSSRAADHNAVPAANAGTLP